MGDSCTYRVVNDTLSGEQHMKLSTRYGLVGIGALTLLGLVQRSRTLSFDGPEIVHFLIGVLPNLAAAIAIPFVFLSIWVDQKQEANPLAIRRYFFILTLVAGVGLIAWEYLQKSSRYLVFDYYDIAATVLGLVVAWLLFGVLTPRTSSV